MYIFLNRGINTRRIEALLSFQNLSHTTPTTNPPHPSLATLFQLSDVGDVYDIDAILLHPLRSSIPSYLWREVASIAYDSGDVLSSLQLEVVGALVNTSSVSGKFIRRSWLDYHMLNESSSQRNARSNGS